VQKPKKNLNVSKKKFYGGASKKKDLNRKWEVPTGKSSVTTRNRDDSGATGQT